MAHHNSKGDLFMNPRRLAFPKADKFALAILLLCFLVGVPLPAQQQAPTGERPAHRRYLFIDLGTLGGPTSYPSASGSGNVTLNDQGEVGAYADIDVPDSNAPGCFNLDCFLSHTFRWKNGHLGELDTIGDNTSAASGINSEGWIAGFSLLGQTDPANGLPVGHAVLWKHQSAIDLGTLAGRESLSVYVNDAGQVVGIATTDVPDPFSFFGTGFQDHTFIWENGVMRDIGTLGGPDALPGAICENSRKDFVTGRSFTSFVANPTSGSLDVFPFLWDRGAITNLGSLGGTFGYGLCANNRGQVVGQSDLAGDIEQHAFLWEHGAMKDLGTLGGTFSLANWLSASGEIVGGATTANDEFFHAALWTLGSITDLGVLPGYDCSNANARNSKGQIVGQAFDCVTQLQHATLWDDGSAVDLNTLVPPDASLELVGAININEQGEILGVGVPSGSPATGDSADFVGRLFLLIPCDRDHGHWAQSCESPVQDSDAANFAGTETTPPELHKGLTREAFSALRVRFARSHQGNHAFRTRNTRP
jgi:probable HAF family extracellular repeat protein